MAGYLESTPTVVSALSTSGTTTGSSGGGIQTQYVVTRTEGVYNEFGHSRFTDGTATRPGVAFLSDASLGMLKSAASIVKQSYGWFSADFISSSTTAQSGATAKLPNQGQLYFSVLSLTSNGGEFGFRSGNTVYRFASIAVG